MSLQQLLVVLSDGEFHSGDALGQLLGVSRTAIWKQLKKVEELVGLDLISIKGKGYCIEGGLDLLNYGAISGQLSAASVSLIDRLEVKEVVASTSDEVMIKALEGCNGFVCAAEQQTAGKGRRGRRWVSPYASNLYFSINWTFSEGVASIEGLSLAVGVAVVNALERVGVYGVKLKWPNDVLYQGRKLAGVLLEVVGDMNGPCQVVVGIGLNVRMPKKAEIDQPWVDLHSIEPLAADRNRVLAALLDQLLPLLAGYEKSGFTAFRERWLALDAYASKRILISLGPSTIEGKAVGVDVNGALLLETVEGIKSFNGGEVSVRRAE
jgi:BirA family biotin operon repressor/biotin-[acetyl-CoA-carboxylase] ligase